MSYRIDLSSASAAISSIGMDEINGTHAETLNDIDYLDFTLYINSSEWSDCSPSLTYIDLYSSIADGYLFNGRVISVTDDLAEEGLASKQIHCESEIAYLCDSVCDVQDVLKQMEDYHSYMPGDTIIAQTFIVAMLELHAKTVDAKRRIYPPTGTWNSGGYFEIASQNPIYPQSTINDSLNIDTGSTFSVLKALRDKLGYDIWCEHTDSKAYLKVGLAGSRESGTSGFNIVLSKNMRSLTVERAPVNEGRVTRICPLGGVGADGKRLNIASVNSYSRFLENSSLVAIYGNIDMVVLYDDLVDDGNLTAAQLTAVKNELKSRGQQRLSLLTGGITGIRCRAVDLYELGMRLDADHAAYPFKVGGLYGFDCSIFGITDATQFRLFSKTTDLGAPYDPELTFVLPTATYKTQVTNERLRIQQKFYAQAKAQADRLDNTSVKKTTSSSYDSSTANADTIYLIDNGDDTGEIIMNGTSYGGGSGAPAARVENAAVLLDSDFHDYLINETLMLDIQMPTALYYGANLSDQQDMARAFLVAQGHYCTYAANTTTSYNASTGVWTVGGAPGLYEAIIANRLKFGNIIGDNLKGGFLTFGMNTSATYPTKYVTVELKFTSCSRSVNTSVNPPVLTTSYQAQLVFTMYNTDAPSGNWWETTMTHSTTPAQTPSTLTVYIYGPTNNSNLTGKVVELMMVPNVYRYFDNDTTRYPYGYVDLGDMYIFAKDESGGWGVYRVNMTSGQQWASRIPLTSEAEKCFLLGLSKKTEPQTS